MQNLAYGIGKEYESSNNCLHIYRGADYADFYGFTVKDGMAYGVIDGKIVVVDPSMAVYFEGQGFTLYRLTVNGWEREYWDEYDYRLESTVVYLRRKKIPLLFLCDVVTCDTWETNVEHVYVQAMRRGFTHSEIDLLRTVYDLELLDEWYNREDEED